MNHYLPTTLMIRQFVISTARSPIPLLSAFFLFTFSFLSASTTLHAQEDCPITVSALQGGNSVGGTALSMGATIKKGDTIRTDNGGTLTLTLAEGVILKMGPRSTLYVDVSYCPDAESRAVRLKLISGSVWAQGNISFPKFDISTEQFLATVGAATLSINAQYLDTTYTIEKESQRIETRDWSDTVNVLRYTYPFKGHVATIFSQKGSVTVLPWGSRGIQVKQGKQTTYGFDEAFVSNKPKDIDASMMLFDAAGTYTGK